LRSEDRLTVLFLKEPEPALLLLLALAAGLAALLALTAALTLLAGLLLGLAVAAVCAAGVTAGHCYTQEGDFCWEVGSRINAGATLKVTPGLGWLVGQGTMTMTTTTTPIRFLLLDTETNGLPRNRYAPPSTPNNWPAILQLSWATYILGPDGRTLTQESVRDLGLALPTGEAWNAEAAAIHGISEAEARSGTSAREGLLELQGALRSANVIVAHNLAFDKPILRAAAHREGVRDFWPPVGSVQEFCTMEGTRDLLCLPPGHEKATRWKAPRLNELHTWLFGHPYDISGATLHSSASDVQCLASCLTALLHRGLLPALRRA
jgi:DNA polymerase-3 subunit epsilon